MNVALTTLGDLDFSTANLRLITGSEEISQKLQCRYRMFLGEWFLDARLGVPWIQTIFVKGTSDSLVNSILRKVALTCPGVDKIDMFTVTKDNANRTMSLAFAATLSDGNIINFKEDFIL